MKQELIYTKHRRRKQVKIKSETHDSDNVHKSLVRELPIRSKIGIIAYFASLFIKENSTKVSYLLENLRFKSKKEV